jgi:cell division protein FtsW (lipid II flippase)/cell division protein FtsI/penicillin-binding protein 2
MALTRVTALEREERRLHHTARRLGPGDFLLVAASLVAVMAIALASAGRMRTLAWAAQHGGAAPVVNLNTVKTAEPLASVLRQRFDNPDDAAFATKRLFEFLAVSTDERRVLANVGGILRVQVPVEAIDRDPRLKEYAERLSAARTRAFTAQQALPAAIPLITTADLLELKPQLAVRSPNTFRWTALVWAVLYVIGFHVVSLVWRFRRVEGDRVLLSAVHLLTALGFAALLSRSDPLRDALLFVRFAQGTLVGLVLLTLASAVDFRKKVFGEFSYVPLAIAGALCVLLILFGGGPGGSGAKVNLGPVQPIEAIRLLLVLFLAGYFASRWELLRDIRSRTFRGVAVPASLNLPRVEYVLPVLIGVAVALGFFFVQKDLGPALFLSFIFLSMYAVARRAVVLSVAGLALLVAGFYVGYRLEVSATLADRVRIWQSPWDNAARGGDQIAQAHWALATGAMSGTGLGIGDSRYVPAGHTDLALAAIGEELGLAGLLIVAVLFALIVRRGFRIARGAPTDYAFFLALAVTLTLIVPVLVMAGGMLGLIPLTGVVTPFLSYGGSAMAANLAGVGILAAIRSSRQAGPLAATDPFRIPLRALGGVLAACGIVLVGALVNVQAVRRDDYLVRPQLSLQADGGRRYVYNSRVLDVVRQIPRGTIYDRTGLPLATGDPAVVAKSTAAYDDLGITPARACPNRDERCYPLGGVAFHLLGDARTRLNWSASNTSYVERDREDRLRGFSDYATTVKTTDLSGQPAYAVRRDYRDVVGLVRHRYEPRHPDVTAILARPRDLRLTLDAHLQIRVGAILSRYAKASASGNAAAAVIDAETGDILAAVSYPWPDFDLLDEDRRDAGDLEDELFDRARYGLYPPGSTFKMITAAAALSQGDPGAMRFACRRLPDGRIGATLPGLGRPIRDDVLDTRPHGALELHDALVVSCNAYFAQLALRVGQSQLAGTSARAGISIGTSRQLGRDALAQAGYGQGPVLATPLELARAAAAVGTDGIIRGPRLDSIADQSPVLKSASKNDHLLSAAAARLLARALRDVVLHGTGRQLRAHPGRIAGKTGTAQVAGAASHAWFAGFAPYGATTNRIAFAVILENAGYGGVSAAAAAGEIVSAASSLGLFKSPEQ